MFAANRYDSVHKTTGFNIQASSKYTSFSPSLVSILRVAQPFYQALLPHCTFSTSKMVHGNIDHSGKILDHGFDTSLYPDKRNFDILVWIGTPEERNALLPREHAKLSVFDSAVQGGDAVWEGLRVYRSA